MDIGYWDIEFFSYYEIIYAFFSYIFVYKIVEHYTMCEKRKRTFFYFLAVLFLVIDLIVYLYFPFKTEYGIARHLPNYIEYMLLITIIVLMNHKSWAETLYFSVFGYILVLMINLVIEANLALYYWGNVHSWFFIKCVLLFIIYYALKKIAYEKGHYQAKDFRLFSLFAILSCMYIYGVSRILPDLDYTDGVSVTYLSLCLTFFLILVYALCYLYLRMLGSRTKSLDEVAIQLDNQKRQKEILDELKNANIENRKLRHDLKHHLHSLEYMMETDPIKAKEYLHDINEHIETVNVLISGNPILDYIINSKFAVCREKGIACEYDIQDNIKQMTDFDLISMLSNALDNAIEAQAYVTHKYILCEIRDAGTASQIRIVNTCNPSLLKRQGKRYVSTKEDSSNHGIGLTRIQNVARSYQGNIEIHIEKDAFTLTIRIGKNIEHNR